MISLVTQVTNSVALSYVPSCPITMTVKIVVQKGAIDSSTSRSCAIDDIYVDWFVTHHNVSWYRISTLECGIRAFHHRRCPAQDVSFSTRHLV